MTQERKGLEGADAERERLENQRQWLNQRREQVLQLMGDGSALAQAQQWLGQLQQTYRAAADRSAQLWQRYDGMQRAFLDEQAGILAERMLFIYQGGVLRARISGDTGYLQRLKSAMKDTFTQYRSSCGTETGGII